MKFKKWIKYVDPVSYVIIWTSKDDKEPAFKGWLIDVPKKLMKKKIGRINKDDLEEPIFISNYTNEYKTKLPTIVINLL